MERNFYTFGLVPMDWAVDPPPKSALQVWLVLHDHRNGVGQTSISYSEIMAITDISKSALRAGIGWLKERGLIAQVEGNGLSISRFTFLWNNNVNPSRYVEAVEGLSTEPGQGVGKTDPPVSENKHRTSLTRELTPNGVFNNCLSAIGLRDLIFDSAGLASNWAASLPGIQPPDPVKLGAEDDKQAAKLWRAVGKDRDALEQYFRRCYAYPLGRGLPVFGGSNDWRVPTFRYFLIEQDKIRAKWPDANAAVEMCLPWRDDCEACGDTGSRAVYAVRSEDAGRMMQKALWVALRVQCGKCDTYSSEAMDLDRIGDHGYTLVSDRV